MLPGVQGTATYGTDRHSGPDIKLGPKTLAGMSKDQLLKIAQDKEGKYDVNTQLQAAKRLGDPKLKMTWTDSDLNNLSPFVLGYLSATNKDPKVQAAIQNIYNNHSNPYVSADWKFQADFQTGFTAATAPASQTTDSNQGSRHAAG